MCGGMGCGASSDGGARAEISHSSMIDKDINKARQKEEKIIKLLLLGTGESGKSTFFKQMQILYSPGFSPAEKAVFRHVLRRNIVEAMQTLIKAVAQFELAIEGKEAKRAAKAILETDALSSEFWQPALVDAIIALWGTHEHHPEEEPLSGCPGIHKAYERRSEIQLLDSAEYLFLNVERLGSDNFEPNITDILRARLRTSGIVERMFKIHKKDFLFLDVGGQRNERRKWIHCFSDVTAIIFISAISEYDQVLFEDNATNRLTESIQIFEQICNHDMFTETAIILFFNKADLFRDKIMRIPLESCFPDYRPLPQHASLDDRTDHAADYIKEKFLEVNHVGKDIFTHLTTATNTKNVESVFDSCQKIILKKNLERLGLA